MTHRRNEKSPCTLLSARLVTQRNVQISLEMTPLFPILSRRISHCHIGTRVQSFLKGTIYNLTLNGRCNYFFTFGKWRPAAVSTQTRAHHCEKKKGGN